MEITTIGLDLAKSVVQLHAVDADGAVVWRKKVRRGALLETLAQVPACLVGMEACATAITGRVRYPLWVTKFV